MYIVFSLIGGKNTSKKFFFKKNAEKYYTTISIQFTNDFKCISLSGKTLMCTYIGKPPVGIEYSIP